MIITGALKFVQDVVEAIEIFYCEEKETLPNFGCRVRKYWDSPTPLKNVSPSCGAPGGNIVSEEMDRE